MCLNNWGGIDHKVLEFHEYVNLFSGKSGSGKSRLSNTGASQIDMPIFAPQPGEIFLAERKKPK